MIKQWFLAILYVIALLSIFHSLVYVGTVAYKSVNLKFETRGVISRVDYEGYSCFIGKNEMQCFKDNKE